MDFLVICWLFLIAFSISAFCAYAVLVLSKAHTFRRMGYDWIEAIEKAKGFYS